MSTSRRFNYYHLITKTKNRALETIGFLIFIALAVDFTLKEIVPIFRSIWQTLHGP